MRNDKQVNSMRRWSCTGCHITLGFIDDTTVSLREGRGKVKIDIADASSVERECSSCGTLNRLECSHKLLVSCSTSGK